MPSLSLSFTFTFFSLAPTLVSSAMFIAVTHTHGETALPAQTQEAATMTEGNAKCIEWLPAAAPGLLASPQPGLELCLSFFVPDF